MMQKEHANTNDDVVPFLGFESVCMLQVSISLAHTQKVDVSEITRADL